VDAEFLGQLRSPKRRCSFGVKLGGCVLYSGTINDPSVQRGLASRAAREAAVQLLRRRGVEDWLPDNTANGAGLVGSAHDRDVAVAAIAPCDEAAAIGIDVEPAMGLPPECLRTVVSRTKARAFRSLWRRGFSSARKRRHSRRSAQANGRGSGMPMSTLTFALRLQSVAIIRTFRSASRSDRGCCHSRSRRRKPADRVQNCPLPFTGGAHG
jgi:hypothetical protein